MGSFFVAKALTKLAAYGIIKGDIYMLLLLLHKTKKAAMREFFNCR